VWKPFVQKPYSPERLVASLPTPPLARLPAPPSECLVKFFKLVQIGTPVTIAESLRRMTRLAATSRTRPITAIPIRQPPS